LGLAVVGLLILVILVVIAIPIIIRVFGEAARRNPNRPGGEGEDRIEDDDNHSGPNRG
jgi:hypothetical protein